MNHGKICISVCARTAKEMLDRVNQAIPAADVVELRLDCVSPDEIDSVLENLPETDKQYLVTYRPADQGGYTEAGRDERIRFWIHALIKLRTHDLLIDHEADIELPEPHDPDRTIVSFHDFDRTPGDLGARFDSLSSHAAKIIKIAVTVSDSSEAATVWRVLDRVGPDRRVIPIAMGEAGKWTRVLGLAYGAPLTYASLEADGSTAPGQILAADLDEVFRVKELDRETSVYGVVAGDTSYSLSPFMHNAAFRSAGMNSVFVPFQVADLEAFIRRMITRSSREVELPIAGLSITNPHKQAVIAYLDHIDETAREIGAVARMQR